MNRTTSGIALTGFAAVLTLLAFTPASASFLDTNNADSPVLYGMAELTHKNADGDIIASQTVHNRLLDWGEQTLIEAVFKPTSYNTGKAPDVICITDATPAEIANEGAAASVFTPELTFASATTQTCVRVSVDFTNTNVTRTILNATFYGSDGGPGTRPANILEGETITAIAICDGNNNADLLNCASHGSGAFSAVTVNNTPVGAADSVDVMYTFDLSSSDN